MAVQPNLRLVDPPQDHPFAPVEVDLDDAPAVTILEDGAARTVHPDGSVSFDENPGVSETEGDENDFYRNLANEIDGGVLAAMASELLTGIEYDQQSRKDWLETRATGIKLLGLKLEEPRGDMSTSSAPLEGMSTVRHPLLLDATIRFQATARGELLPASGPVKVRNDLPQRPDATPSPPPAGAAPSQPSPMGHNGGPPLAEGDKLDALGAALEKDMNHYLTVTASEYVPDTDRMLFYVGFGGDGFKKVYNCPLRRRPVSESVDAEDIIVSNATVDLRNCGRVTHKIKMRPSWLKRMQIDGYYRDVSLAPPNPATPIDAVESEKANQAGVRARPMQPKDADYEVYEVYCEWDLDKYAPEQFRGKQLPLPYVVTLEKESRQVLAVRRNWKEDDEQALAKQFFVQFPFIRGLNFYGIGLVHILGNVTMALTAIWRIMIDNGMFANFPGFLFAKSAGRQNTNQFRVPVGGGLPVDVPPGMKIQDAFMAIPYKETGSAFTTLAAHIEEVGQRLGQTADLNIGEGKQEVPVGTTMALIEQATKIMDSVHKRLHAAQAEEFGLLKERFREDPEAFWRHNKRPSREWTSELFVQALSERELVPVADPNNPTSLHRIAKATIIDTLVQKYGEDMDKRAALKRIMRIADIDADGLLRNQTAAPQPDPRMVAIQAKAQAEQMKAQIDQAKVWVQAQTAQANIADKQQERAFKERMQQFEIYLEGLRVKAEMIIHAHDLHRDNAQAQQEMAGNQASAVHEIARDHAQHTMDLAQQQNQHAHEMQVEREKAKNQQQVEQQKTEQQLAADQQRHEQAMQHADALNAAKVTAAKQMAAAKPKPKSGSK